MIAIQSAILILAAHFSPSLDSYLQREFQGDHKKGEIEIVSDPAQISAIEASQTAKLTRKGVSREEAGESSRVGVVAEDIYWIWIRDAVLFPGGATGTYDRLLWKNSLKGCPGVAVLPILPDGRISLNLQFRHATRSWEFEMPRGLAMGGESMEEAARRELQEETGLLVNRLFFLGEVAPDSGALSSVIPVYIGWVGSKGESDVEESEAIAGAHAFTLQEIEEGFERGYIEVEPQGKVPIRDSFLTFALFRAKTFL